MGWWHGFMLHFLCNDCGEILVFTLTGTNVDDRDERVSSVFAKILFGKVFADRGTSARDSSIASSRRAYISCTDSGRT